MGGMKNSFRAISTKLGQDALKFLDIFVKKSRDSAGSSHSWSPSYLLADTGGPLGDRFNHNLCSVSQIQAQHQIDLWAQRVLSVSQPP